MKLRPYQKTAIATIVAELRRHDSDDRNAHPWVLAGLPTGSGKTLVGLLAAAEASDGGAVIWLAKQKELLKRAEEELDHAVAKGLIDENHVFQFITIQGFMNLRTERDDALIVFDEAHHLHNNNEWIKDIRRRRLPTLGLTATPRWSHESDGWRLAHYVTRDALTPLWLAPPVPRIRKTGFTPKHVRLKSINGTETKDFDSDTYRALNHTKRNEIVADFLWQHRAELSPMIVYTARIEHAEKLARVLAKKGLKAAYVHGELSGGERDQVFHGFRNGAIEALVNVFLVAEGVDIPDAKSIVMAVPTISDIRFVQMLGRGCRKTKNKRYFNLVDFVDNLGRFEHLLGEKYLYDGSMGSDRSGDAERPEYLREYRCATERPDQPYLKKLRQRLIKGFALDEEVPALSPELVELHLTHFCKDEGLPFCLDGVRPLEVPLVHDYVYPLLQERRPDASVHKEVPIAEEQRCDILIPGKNTQVIEFATTRVNDEKVDQLLGYVKTLRAQRYSKTVEGTLVAVSLNGDSTTRTVERGHRTINFYNWHDFLKQHVIEAPVAST